MKFDKQRIFWWSPKPFLGLTIFQKENVGDYLGPLLVQKILDAKNLHVNDIRKSKLLTIGSVLHFANDGDVVWGSGVNGKIDAAEHKFSSLDIRAVRGPLTAEFLFKRGINVPSVFGDPGILTALFWPRTHEMEKGKVIYIPHMREKETRQSGMKTLSPLLPLEEFVKEIQTAEKVISSSLHGVIIAESYGVPACLYENKSGEKPFKYEDYYAGTGRGSFRLFDSISEAKAHDPEVPKFEDIQEKLLASFPWDLWK